MGISVLLILNPVTKAVYGQQCIVEALFKQVDLANSLTCPKIHISHKINKLTNSRAGYIGTINIPRITYIAVATTWITRTLPQRKAVVMTTQDSCKKQFYILVCFACFYFDHLFLFFNTSSFCIAYLTLQSLCASNIQLYVCN